jgi:RNA polymerase sigma factor (sigma-70 family)
MNRTRATRHAAEAEQQPPVGGTSRSPAERAAERLEEVFLRYQDALLGTLYYLVGNSEDAHDTLQETFVKCWRNRDSLAEVENLRAWVFRVALNAARDMRTTAWRRRRRPLDKGVTTLAASDPGPDAHAARREQLALIRQALHQLRPEEQEVFLLRQNGQMTYAQIAEATEIPLGTVKTRMRLALSKLRQALESR